MSYLGIVARADGLTTRDGAPLTCALSASLASAPALQPVTILVHGYRFDATAGENPGDDPHRSLFAFAPEEGCRRIRSWPRGLGFAPEGGPLCIGFGWPAVAPHLPSLLARGRTGFAEVYDRAAAAAALLADLVRRIHALAPGRVVDIVAHSLGARVALAALPHLDGGLGRIVLLGAAEFDTRAHDALGGFRGTRLPEIYNVTARANDLYDALFETFAPRRRWSDRALGLGLKDAPAQWLDLQIDRPGVSDWLAARGVTLAPQPERFCHWSFYTRDGAFALYRAILSRRPGWDVTTLREAPCLHAQDRRWSRLPRPRLRPVPSLPLGLTRA